MCKATDLVQALAFVPSTQSVARINSDFGDYDGRGQQTASPMLTAIMSGGDGKSVKVNKVTLATLLPSPIIISSVGKRRELT